jgi:hypothetical protein
VRGIESNNCLCEFKNAWTLLARFHDAAKIIGGILVCLVQCGIMMRVAQYRGSISTLRREGERYIHSEL